MFDASLHADLIRPPHFGGLAIASGLSRSTCGLRIIS